tara:strand:+ start:126 stop:533 length:408 start_codon:yes stop_codon:yes gene_type:complete
MKAKTFENLIRKVVREEIDYSLRREIKTLKEDLRDELKPTIVEHTKRQVEIPEVSKTSLREKIMGSTPIKQRPTQNYTSNGALNDLLNETAQGSTNTETATSPGLPIEAMPAPVQDVVNRDYRELMKAIDNKKNK